MTKLIFLDTDFAGRVHELALEKTTVGRDESNHLTLLHPSVSARHCEILVHGPEVIVCDLDSRNGVFVDGVRVKKQCQVKSGQVLRIGSVSARLQLELPPLRETDDATAVTAVYALRRHEHELEKAPEARAPGHVSLQPAAGPAPEAGDRTVILPVPPAPPQPSVSSAASVEARSARARRIRRLVLLVVVLGVALLGLVLFLWRK
jgi:predicted component of type VI protein secretion system